MPNIDINQARDRLSELIDKTIDGKDIVIIRSGQPVAKLIAIKGRIRKRQFGGAKGLIRMSDDFDEPLEDFKDYI